MHSHSPTRSQIKKHHQHKDNDDDEMGTTLFQLNSLSLNSEKALGLSPARKVTTPAGKKVRKLTARKWDLGDENELDEGFGRYY